MNLLDAEVLEITGPIEELYGHFFVPVKYDCWDVIGVTRLSFKTLEEAQKVCVGYEFLT